MPSLGRLLTAEQGQNFVEPGDTSISSAPSTAVTGQAFQCEQKLNSIRTQISRVLDIPFSLDWNSSRKEEAAAPPPYTPPHFASACSNTSAFWKRNLRRLQRVVASPARLFFLGKTHLPVKFATLSQVSRFAASRTSASFDSLVNTSTWDQGSSRVNDAVDDDLDLATFGV
ncbi:hypothetical protein BDZ89DRAFT_1162663 [Hymenopellis radicata]|nr:hypothetical protein BDZ89DRAFT_1162663 [Hymenopellis radicata]